MTPRSGVAAAAQYYIRLRINAPPSPSPEGRRQGELPGANISYLSEGLSPGGATVLGEATAGPQQVGFRRKGYRRGSMQYTAPSASLVM
jgi:hypothetical protein